MTKRWKQRPAGSTWGDWGDDDELGRINLLTPEKVLQGVREVEAGISFCLSLPLDYPGGTVAEPAPLPADARADRRPRRQPRELLQRPPEGHPEVRQPPARRRVGRRRQVTLSLQYSTQWDSLAHAGAEFDADGDGVEEAVYLQRLPRRGRPRRSAADAAGDGGRHRCFAKHLGLEHMAVHGRAGPRRARRRRAPSRSRVPRRQPRACSKRSWPPTTWSWNRATCC